MKNKLSFFSLSSCLLIAACVTVISCNKKFDEPPVYEAPVITPDLTIADLKAMHSYGRFEQITEDKTIGGVVIADDRSGQFYKTIVIQDETGGISIRLDGYDLYTSYPIGRMVYVKVKDLYLGDYNKLIQLGGGTYTSGTATSLDYITSTLIDEHLIKGNLDNTVTPKVIAVADLDNYADQNTLIQLDNYEFATADTASTFAKPDLSSSAVNFTIQSCIGKSIILRNSSYADFAGYNVPNGNGSITAVFTVFGSTQQLNIRDSSDVKFYNNRCGSGGTGEVVDIATIRSFFSGENVTIGSYKIGGVVISDAASKNISNSNLVLQDKNAGIKLYFSGASVSKFAIGDSLVVDVSGGTLQDYNGSLEISLSSSALPSAAIATGKVITPKELTITQIKDQLPGIEYTLVKIKDATVPNGTFSGSKTLTDVTGSMTLYTLAEASFAGATTPTEAKTWTGYCLMFNTTAELVIRNSTDITDGDVNPPTANDNVFISEYVEGSSNNKYLEIYNAGPDAADLTKYTIKLYTNGGATATSTATIAVVTSSTTLAAGAVIVLKYSSASLALPSGVTAYSSSVCNFNGNDALTLEKDGTVIDVFGLVGTDPVDSWTISGDSTAAKDKSVRRKSTITKGNTDWATSSASEWDVISTIDDVSNLGTR